MTALAGVLQHEEGKFLQCCLPERQEPLWKYVYGGKPKPFFHPLRTPRGHCVSAFEPEDHVWHRGLWFAIKYINGENFWEEREPFGFQVTSLPLQIERLAEGAFAWTSSIEWRRPGECGNALMENRRITFRPWNDGSYALDWDIQLVPQGEVLLDRTPFTTWGGYGGLTLRGNPQWRETRLLFSDGSTSERPIGNRASWCDLWGVFDGDLNSGAGVTIFDHPENPRSPSPWYGGTGPNHYFNAAFLFHEPMEMQARQELKLRYRVLVYDGVKTLDALHRAFTSYAAGTSVL